MNSWHSCHLKNSYSFFKTQSRTCLFQDAFCDYHLTPSQKLSGLVRQVGRMGCFSRGRATLREEIPRMEDLAKPPKPCSQDRHLASGEHQLPTEATAKRVPAPS